VISWFSLLTSMLPNPYARPHSYHHYIHYISTMADALVWECVKVSEERDEGRGKMIDIRETNERGSAYCCYGGGYHCLR